MSEGGKGTDPLLKAIAEFREELIQWIDAQLVILRQREPDQGNSSANSDHAESRPVTQELIESSPAADSRQRLNALARQLKDRLRHSGGSRGGGERGERTGQAEDAR
jgi:hypothetical protein